ncbi:UNVERIFIED_CONTAM: hypothetical protein Slati_2461300, partial [Sesamum latifolium]
MGTPKVSSKNYCSASDLGFLVLFFRSQLGTGCFDEPTRNRMLRRALVDGALGGEDRFKQAQHFWILESIKW